MSQLVTVSTIQERVRALCKLPALTANTPITTVAMLDFLQAACRKLGALVKERSGENYLTSSGPLTTTAGISIVSLPPQCSDLLRLAWRRSEAEEIELTRANPDEMQAYPSAWGDGWAVQYRLVGNALEFFPTPDGAYNLRIYYSTGLYVTSTSDQFMCRDNWDQWIALYTCRLVRAAEQKACPEFDMMFAEVDSDVRAQLRRDHFGPRQARDVRSREYRRRPEYWRP
jgi:hypothetical protein